MTVRLDVARVSQGQIRRTETDAGEGCALMNEERCRALARGTEGSGIDGEASWGGVADGGSGLQIEDAASVDVAAAAVVVVAVAEDHEAAGPHWVGSATQDSVSGESCACLRRRMMVRRQVKRREGSIERLVSLFDRLDRCMGMMGQRNSGQDEVTCSGLDEGDGSWSGGERRACCVWAGRVASPSGRGTGDRRFDGEAAESCQNRPGLSGGATGR